ncbi:hypothetical protein ACFLQL_00390 [Verrucomicrobiota bacterium]
MEENYENESYKCTPEHRHERYSRVENKDQFDKNLEESNIAKDVNPMKGRRFHKVYPDAK